MLKAVLLAACVLTAHAEEAGGWNPALELVIGPAPTPGPVTNGNLLTDTVNGMVSTLNEWLNFVDDGICFNS